MGALGTLGRRTFLLGSVAVVGGVAFGTYAYRKPHENPLLTTLGDGEAALTPYVRIAQDGITLITPRADKGQGAYSMQAYLLAEELDVDPLMVQTEPGPPSAAYFNDAVLAESLPFSTYDTSATANAMRRFASVPAKLLGIQITGGSSTVPDAFIKLRHAGAVARETLKQAAAEQWGVSRDSLSTENGRVIAADGRSVAYEALATAAAELTPVRIERLRPEREWRYLGKPLQRLDVVRKSTGTERYGIDLRLPDMVYATVRANPGLGGPVISADTKAAEGMRGVQKVVPISHGFGVIADNTWRAIKAARAIEVQWGPAPYLASSAEMWAALADTADGDAINSRSRDDGDVETALTGSGVLAAEYKVPYLAHAPLEPMNAIVRVSSDKTEIWTGTQIPRFLQTHVSKITGHSPDAVQVYVQPMGGSFGHRLEDTHVLQAVEVAQAVPGVPVKMTWSREEDMTHDYPRPMQLGRARGKVVDGQVEAFDLTITAPSVSASYGARMGLPAGGPDPQIVAGAWDQPFAIPHYRVTGKAADGLAPVSSWRSVGASANGFLHGAFLDELFHAAGIDPLQGLIDLCHDDVARAVLEELRELSGWEGSVAGGHQGRGVAFCTSFGVPTAEVVDVTQTENGIRIDRAFAVADVGKVLDPVNLEAQLSGGMLFGLGHAVSAELTYKDYAPEQTNYHQFKAMRIHQAPDVVTKALENAEKIRGIGEPGVPPAAAALANAIFAATGQRIRELPLAKHIDFI